MSKLWTRIAATLALCSLALPAMAAEYGEWKLIDTQTSKEFVPDSKAPQDLYGEWRLIDTRFNKAFLADADLPPGGRYGKWELADIRFDRQWLGDGAIRRTSLDGSEVGRELISDDAESDRQLKETGSKEYGKPTEKLLNPTPKETVLDSYKKRDAGRPTVSTVEKYRIDTIYDKEVTRPWTQELMYAERANHTRTYDVTWDLKERLSFRDPLKGDEVTEYTFKTEKRKDVKSTGFVETGKTFKEKRTGKDVDPLVKYTAYGDVKEREIGRTADIAQGSARTTGNQVVAISSGNISYGSQASKVIYTGMKERKELAIDRIEVAKVQPKDKNAVTVSEHKKIGDSNFKVNLAFNELTREAVLSGEIITKGEKKKVDPIKLTLAQLPLPGQAIVAYTGDTVIIKLERKDNGKYELSVEEKDHQDGNHDNGKHDKDDDDHDNGKHGGGHH